MKESVAASQKDKTVGILCIIGTILLFATFEVTSKLLSPVMGPVQITFTRFLIGGLALLPFALRRIMKKSMRWGLRQFGGAALLGFINIVVSMGLIQWGLVYADASLTAVIFSANPVFVAILAVPLLGEGLNARKLVGLALGLVGVAILFIGRPISGSDQGFGALLVVGAAICFALYTVLGKRIIASTKTDSLSMTTLSILAGSLFLLPTLPFIGFPSIDVLCGIVPELLYMSLLVTGLAYVLYFEGLSRLEAGAGSLVYFAKPPIATLLAAIVLGEQVEPRLFASILVIACGIILAVFAKDKSRGA